MLCILSLIHKSEHDFKGHKNGYCEISCEKTELPCGVSYVDESGNHVEVDESHGNLQMNGYVTIINNGKEVAVCYPVLTTSLNAEKWCSESLFSIKPRENGLYIRRVGFEGTIGVSNEFQLVSTNA